MVDGAQLVTYETDLAHQTHLALLVVLQQLLAGAALRDLAVIRFAALNVLDKGFAMLALLLPHLALTCKERKSSRSGTLWCVAAKRREQGTHCLLPELRADEVRQVEKGFAGGRAPTLRGSALDAMSQEEKPLLLLLQSFHLLWCCVGWKL